MVRRAEVFNLYQSIIDAHIHLDLYEEKDQELIMKDLDKYKVEALISVSQNLISAKDNLRLSKKNNKIKPAFGFHPEQPLPTDNEFLDLQSFIEKNDDHMIAVGEVGLPYYLRQENPSIPIEPYQELLESFIKQASILDKPIILHAVYEDAPIVCAMLEKYSLKKAHFHWFKGDAKTIEHMQQNGYFISITPDILYEKEIQQLVKSYPLSLMMVETDGPWKFEGPFKGDMTHPKMIHRIIREIAFIKETDVNRVYEVLYENTKQFYNLR